MDTTLQRSHQFRSALEALRLRGALDWSGCDLTIDERSYLLAEFNIRKATFSQVERDILPGTSPETKELILCYRNLFTNPKTAIDQVQGLITSAKNREDLERYRLWEAHLHLLLGSLGTGSTLFKRAMEQHQRDSFWSQERHAIQALGFYFLGETRTSIERHEECQRILDSAPDNFIKTFNASMACRAALKIRDSQSFGFFSTKLEEALRVSQDIRYKLRHLSYRATIYNQLCEHEVAEQYWRQGDLLVGTSESELEKGQYYLLRGLSQCTIGQTSSAKKTFKLATQSFVLAGSPEQYLVELEIGRTLGPLANPIHRARSIKTAAKKLEEARFAFATLLESCSPESCQKIREAHDFCSSLIEGIELSQCPDGRSSLMLSLIENISHTVTFAEGVGHFNLVSSFVRKLDQSDLSCDGVAKTLKATLDIEPEYHSGQFRLPESFQEMESEPEVKSLLETAAILATYSTTYKDLVQTQAKLKTEQDYRTIAAQVSHDIRSPLAALEILLHSLNELPPDKRLVIQGAVHRIRDIANDLLSRSKKLGFKGLSESSDGSTRTEAVMLAGLLNQVVSEKRLQYRPQSGIRIELNLSQDAQRSFVLVDPHELQRVVSNLLDNSIQAIFGETGEVRLGVSLVGRSVQVRVTDTGCGMSEETLRNAGTPGFTSGKSGGSGLGLSHAFKAIKTWRGRMEIQSKLGRGTEIRLDLPLSEPPHWFANQIHVARRGLVIVDDELSVHDTWKQVAKMTGHGGQNLFHLTTPSALRTFYRDHIDCIEEFTFVLDQEFNGHPETGLSLIQELGLDGQAILVTSHFESNDLISECVRTGVRIAPKQVLPAVTWSVTEAISILAQ